MKLIVLLICLMIADRLSGQTTVAGIYNDRDGSTLTLLEDGRFRFRWQFDLASSWTNGRWRISRDTVYLESLLVYDTVSYSGKDSLVLSTDELSSRVSSTDVLMEKLSGGGQNRKKVPAKFCLRKGNLYPIIEGRAKRLYRNWYFSKKG